MQQGNHTKWTKPTTETTVKEPIEQLFGRYLIVERRTSSGETTTTKSAAERRRTGRASTRLEPAIWIATKLIILGPLVGIRQHLKSARDH